MLFVLMYAFVALFFFFSSRRRHTRYWRDWSSDVCSSDLGASMAAATAVMAAGALALIGWMDMRTTTKSRSEERRVGKECRSRGWLYHEKKKGRGKGTKGTENSKIGQTYAAS